MQALAIHCEDAGLERMLRLGAPVYVSPAEMRSAEGRDLSGLRRRVADLLASPDPADVAVAIRLAGFLGVAEDARPLLAPFLDEATPREVRQSAIGTMKALGFYDPSMLPVLSALLEGRADGQAWFLTSYMAEYGDLAARDLVGRWLDVLDLDPVSRSRMPTLRGLLAHDDSRGAVIRFYRRMAERGHRMLDANDLSVLAEEGDEVAREALLSAAYRGPDSFDIGPVARILHLLKSDPEEAFFASTRLLARHRRPEAVRLMFRIAPDRAGQELLSRFRTLPPSLRAEVGRNFRAHVPEEAITQTLNALAGSADAGDRRTAAELGGWMFSGLPLTWLPGLADDEDAAVRAAAAEALRRRTLEAAAVGHLAALVTSGKPLQWARLHTVFDLVDPRFLWSPDDPVSIGPFLDSRPYEFVIEARQLNEKRAKKVAEAEKKADEKAE